MQHRFGTEDIIIDDALLVKLRQRATRLNVETGGHLFARIENNGSRLHIVHEIGAPPDSKLNKHTMVLGNQGVYEASLGLHAQGIYRIGHWHSHPPQNGGTTHPSTTDLDALRRTERGEEGNAIGAWLMLILSGQAHSLWLCRNGKIEGVAEPPIQISLQTVAET